MGGPAIVYIRQTNLSMAIASKEDGRTGCGRLFPFKAGTHFPDCWKEDENTKDATCRQEKSMTKPKWVCHF